MNLNKTMLAYATITAAVVAAGCLSVKTEHEVKPIEINMNVNLKLDKQLEELVGTEQRPDLKKLFDRGAVGIDNRAMVAPRGAMSSEEMEFVLEVNKKRKERFEAMAKESGSTYEEVAKSAAPKFVERLPEGKGIWYQTAEGEWVQKK